MAKTLPRWLALGLLLAVALPSLGQMATAPPAKSATIFGQKIVYYDVGSGPALVLLHGLGGYKEEWLATLAPLSAKYRVIVPDQVGFGESDKPLIDYSIQTYVDFLGEFLRQIGVQHAILVGNSLGGWIAINYALQAGANSSDLPKADKLVLADSAGYSDTVTIQPLELNPSSLEQMRNIIKLVFYNNQWATPEAVKEAFTGSLKSHNGYTIHSIVTNPLLAKDVVDGKLGGLHIPTLVLWGQNDALISLSIGERLAKDIAGAKLMAIPQCGHMPHMEKPAEFVQVVMGFLAQ